MRFFIASLSHVIVASMVMRRRMLTHSLLTLFTDTTPGGGLDIILQETGSALLQEDGSYLLRE